MPEADPPPSPTTAKGATSVEELSRAQVQHARRVAESRATVPDLTLAITADLQAASEMLPEAGPAGYEALVVKAAALALRESPRANGAYRDGRFEQYERVNVGVVLATRDASVTPVVVDADTKAPEVIAAELTTLTRRARAGEITQPELSGATFAVTSLAEFGTAWVTPLLHPPQAAGLGMGAVADRPTVVEGAVVVRPVVELTLVCDHRILHAADAARLLRRIGELLEQPAALSR